MLVLASSPAALHVKQNVYAHKDLVSLKEFIAEEVKEDDEYEKDVINRRGMFGFGKIPKSFAELLKQVEEDENVAKKYVADHHEMYQ